MSSLIANGIGRCVTENKIETCLSCLKYFVFIIYFMKYIILIGKRNIYLRCLKNFLLHCVFKGCFFVYFQNIQNFLKYKKKMNNVYIFVFEDVLELKDFIQLCFLYGSDQVNIVSLSKQPHLHYYLHRQYQMKEFVIDVKYNGKDCFIETTALMKHNGRTLILRLDDIYYVESFYGRIYFYTCYSCYDGKYISFYKYQTILEELGFVKVRKGCYVNKTHIKGIENNVVILSNDKYIFFSKSVSYKSIQI